jgi:ComF family protein
MNSQMIIAKVSRIAAPLLDVLFPPRCLGCGKGIEAEDVLCRHCLAELLPLPVDEETSRLHLSSLTFPSEASMMAIGYEHEAGGVLEACIHAMKYRGMYRVGVWLGRLLGEQLHGTDLLQGDPVLVPVPLHRVKRLERGYNQAEMICRGLAAECGIEHWPELLRRGRYTTSQAAARLHREQRRGNMIDAFSVDAAVADTVRSRPVIIVDDLVTTGATMGECAAALAVCGFTDLRFVALSRPPMRGRDGDRKKPDTLSGTTGMTP